MYVCVKPSEFIQFCTCAHVSKANYLGLDDLCESSFLRSPLLLAIDICSSSSGGRPCGISCQRFHVNWCCHYAGLVQATILFAGLGATPVICRKHQ